MNCVVINHVFVLSRTVQGDGLNGNSDIDDEDRDGSVESWNVKKVEKFAMSTVTGLEELDNLGTT